MCFFGQFYSNLFLFFFEFCTKKKRMYYSVGNNINDSLDLPSHGDLRRKRIASSFVREAKINEPLRSSCVQTRSPVRTTTVVLLCAAVVKSLCSFLGWCPSEFAM